MTAPLATRCPACSTVFRVVPDQLRVSDGWVRCGRCAEVFNATESLVDLESGAPRDWVDDPPRSAMSSAPDAASPAARAPAPRDNPPAPPTTDIAPEEAPPPPALGAGPAPPRAGGGRAGHSRQRRGAPDL